MFVSSNHCICSLCYVGDRLKILGRLDFMVWFTCLLATGMSIFSHFPPMLWSSVTSFAWGNVPFALMFSDPPWNSWYHFQLELPYTISLHWECLEWTNYNHSHLDSPMLLMKFTEPGLFTSSDGNHKNVMEALFNFSCLMNILVPLSSVCLLLETKPVHLVIKLICVEALELPPIS